MKKVKYISIEKLKENLEKIIADVYKNKAEYIVMKNNQPHAKITPSNVGSAKEMVMAEDMEDKLKKFVD